MTFYVNFPPEVIAATAEAAAVAEEGITVEPDVDLAEKVNHMILECAGHICKYFFKGLKIIRNGIISISDKFKL